MAASQRSCGLKTLPTPVSGIGSIAENLSRDRRALGRALAHPSLELARRDCRPRLQLHIADRQFAGISVGLADDSGKADGGMLEQDVLYWGGIDVMAAADHQVLGAAGDPEKSVFVETAKITGIDPIAVNESALVVLLVEIAAEHSGPAMMTTPISSTAQSRSTRPSSSSLTTRTRPNGTGRPTEPNRTGRSG